MSTFKILNTIFLARFLLPPGNQTKFTAKSSSVAQEWVEKIRIAITQEEERQRREVGSGSHTCMALLE